MTNLDSIFKSRDFTLPTKVHLIKAMVFPVDWKSDWTELKCYHWRLSRSRLVRELTAWIQRMISVTISWTEGYAEGKQLRKQVGLLFPLQFSHSVVSDTLQPQKSQHARPPCSSPTASLPKPCPLNWWCHPTISSSVVPFSSCPKSLPASGSIQMSQLFASGGQNTGVSALTSVLGTRKKPTAMKIQHSQL